MRGSSIGLVVRLLRTYVLTCALAVLIAPTALAGDALTMWYAQPAAKWTEALPIGNGRMGGMVFGDQFGTIQVNEDTVWAGSVVDRNRTPAPGSLARARELWFKGDVVGAQKIMQDEFMTPEVTRSYQPLCTVGTRWSETFAKIEDFRRSLDLATGVAETTFTADGAKYRCRMFASDERGKTDLRPAEGYSYRYKDPGAPGAAPGRHYGPMAQDLEKTPAGRSTVVDTPQGKMVDTGRLTMVTAAATSETQRRLDDAEDEIARLRKLVKGAA